MTKRKSKIGVVSGVISATESESEEAERFHFFRLGRLRSAYNLVKTRLSDSEAEAKDKSITMNVPKLCDWFASSASASDSDNMVFTRS